MNAGNRKEFQNHRLITKSGQVKNMLRNINFHCGVLEDGLHFQHPSMIRKKTIPISQLSKLMPREMGSSIKSASEIDRKVKISFKRYQNLDQYLNHQCMVANPTQIFGHYQPD